MKLKYIVLGLIFATLTIAGWVLTLKCVPQVFGMPDKAGEFGDMFGAVNALFSGFAFAGLLLTIIIQMDQLTHAREEMGLQRDLFSRQQIDATFFRLLDYYHQHLEAIVLGQKCTEAENKKIKGVEALSFLLDKFNEEWKKRPTDFYGNVEYERLETAHFFVSKINQVLIRQSRYLETFQSLLEFVDDEVADEDEKERYFSIVASQLTSFELRYIYYRSVASTEEDGFRDIILRSGILPRRASVLGIPKLCLKIATENFSMPLEACIRPKTAQLRELRKLRRKARKAARKAAMNCDGAQNLTSSK